MNAQLKLENMVNTMLTQYGKQKTIEIIKIRGIGPYKQYKNYPNGVFVFCNSPEGGVMIGSRR